jgi:hypothetical protein
MSSSSLPRLVMPGPHITSGHCCCHLQGFSPGIYQLYACALDTMGARSCQTAGITVNPPAAVTPAEVTSAVTSAVSTITAIDTDQLKATGGHVHQQHEPGVHILSCIMCVLLLHPCTMLIQPQGTVGSGTSAAVFKTICLSCHALLLFGHYTRLSHSSMFCWCIQVTPRLLRQR